MQKKIKAYVKAAGLPERLHIRALRASFASWSVQSGTPILAVSKLIGHSDVRITQKHYAYLAPEHLHDVVNRLDVTLN